MSVEKTVDRLPDIKKAMEMLTKSQVMVGIPQSLAQRDDPEISNAQLGYIHEYGSPERNIPARPFLIPGIESIQDKTNKRFERAAKEALEGDSAAVERTYNLIGLAAEKAVVEQIDKQEFVPLQPATLKARKERGHMGEQILVETGKMRASITYVIRDK